LTKKEKDGVETTVYSIGLTRDHDSSLLNFLAQSGSEVGNFIYVDTQQVDYVEKINEAIGQSINLAITSSSDINKFIFRQENKNLKFDAIVEYEFGTKNSADP